MFPPFPLRYCAQRQQFGPADSPEVAVLDYQSTQQKLMPILATTFGLHFSKVWAGVGLGGGRCTRAVDEG